ncbi:MAG: hypothetical protein DMG36_13935 [Acidobacteria bacterium]|nr:MAG: hypothetical protein DMG36_13935 [Acidobacteriota bacterium]
MRVTSLLFLCLSVFVLMHSAQQNRTFTVAGHSAEIPVTEMGGRSYVEIEALARLANGSLGFRGNQIVLTLPPSNANTSTTAAPGFTKEFLRAGIEQMSVIREWRSALISAVQRGFPITDDWMKSFSDRAQHNLRLVSLAASTESDKNAFQLLTNEFNNMKQLSDRFLDANKSRTYTRSDALENDPLDRRILNCGHAFAAMAATGQFLDDGSCR